MSTLFSSSLIFTIVFFYFKYDQKVTLRDIVGSLLMIICIVLIALGAMLKQQEKDDPEDKSSEMETKISDDDYTLNLVMSLFFAVVTGGLFALNTVSIHPNTAGCGISLTSYHPFSRYFSSKPSGNQRPSVPGRLAKFAQ